MNFMNSSSAQTRGFSTFNRFAGEQGNLRVGGNSILRLSAVAAAMLAAAPVHAADVSSAGIDLSAYEGVWGNGKQYYCKAEPGSEVMPVSVKKSKAGVYEISAYEFSCTVLAVEQAKSTVVAETRCGHEGTDEQSNGKIELGLTADGQMFFSNGGLTVLSRCPSAQ